MLNHIIFWWFFILLLIRFCYIYNTPCHCRRVSAMTTGCITSCIPATCTSKAARCPSLSRTLSPSRTHWSVTQLASSDSRSFCTTGRTCSTTATTRCRPQSATRNSSMLVVVEIDYYPICESLHEMWKLECYTVSVVVLTYTCDLQTHSLNLKWSDNQFWLLGARENYCWPICGPD